MCIEYVVKVFSEYDLLMAVVVHERKHCSAYFLVFFFPSFVLSVNKDSDFNSTSHMGLILEDQATND